MTEFVSPLSLSADERRANLAALNARMARATAKVAADPSQSAKVRESAARDAATARRIAKATSMTYRLSITLATGETHTETVTQMPRHWNSWLMQRMPYGTNFQGATFAREAIS